MMKKTARTRRRAPTAKEETPNAATRAAIKELDAGKGARFASLGALMADLRTEDGPKRKAMA
jgi:hypothetical protein